MGQLQLHETRNKSFSKATLFKFTTSLPCYHCLYREVFIKRRVVRKFKGIELSWEYYITWLDKYIFCKPEHTSGVFIYSIFSALVIVVNHNLEGTLNNLLCQFGSCKCLPPFWVLQHKCYNQDTRLRLFSTKLSLPQETLQLTGNLTNFARFRDIHKLP